MVTSKLVEIQKFQTKIAELEKSLRQERQKLLRLPAKLGYASLRELIAALAAAASSPDGKATRGVSVTKTGKPRRPRTEITTEMKQKVKALVGEHKTAAYEAISPFQRAGISLGGTSASTRAPPRSPRSWIFPSRASATSRRSSGSRGSTERGSPRPFVPPSPGSVATAGRCYWPSASSSAVGGTSLMSCAGSGPTPR